ncbi:unnamed protein product [Prunus armeniaca]
MFFQQLARRRKWGRRVNSAQGCWAFAGKRGSLLSRSGFFLNKVLRWAKNSFGPSRGFFGPQHAIKLYNSHVGKQSHKSAIQKTLRGTPPQLTNVECGYYMMHFMRDTPSSSLKYHGVSEGTLTVSGSNDGLTFALGTPEHGGRVRGIGAGVSPSQFFNFPRQQRVKFVDKLKENVMEAVKEETLRIKTRAKESVLDAVKAEREYMLKQFNQLIPNFDPNMLKTPSTPISLLPQEQSPKNPMSDKASFSSATNVRPLVLEEENPKLDANAAEQQQVVEFCTKHLSDVHSELNEEDNNGVSKNLRRLAAGPSMAMPSYKSYLINGVKFNTKAQDDVQIVQNNGVYLLAHTMQVASAKDKNSIVSNMGFYDVIQEIWDLDYQKFRIPVFRCDWIDNTSGLVVDKLGFTLVDLSKFGHKNDQFVMASQVKQVFFVDNPMHRGWSVVLSMPNREYNDVIGDDVLGDIRIECEPFTRGMPNVDTFNDLMGEFGSENIRDGCEDIWIV